MGSRRLLTTGGRLTGSEGGFKSLLWYSRVVNGTEYICCPGRSHHDPRLYSDTEALATRSHVLDYIMVPHSKVCSDARNSSWITKLFFLVRGCGLRTRLGRGVTLSTTHKGRGGRTVLRKGGRDWCCLVDSGGGDNLQNLSPESCHDYPWARILISWCLFCLKLHHCLHTW